MVFLTELTPMETIFADFGTFVTTALSSITEVLGVVTSEPLLLIGIFAGLLGLGIGLLRKFL